MTERFVIKTLGCKVNQSESETIAADFRRKGFLELTSSSADSDSHSEDDSAAVCVINTCTVTGKASMQSRQAIRKAIRDYPDARIIVTGCYAQVRPEEIRKIPGVHDVVLQEDKFQASTRILSGMPDSSASDADPWPDVSDTEKTIGKRTRAFLKVQDGCNAHCTYCIVPKARGQSRSMPIDRVLSNLHRLDLNGYKEVVLAGIHLGCYGMDLSPAHSLFSLLERIDDLDIIHRIRLSSIEPQELSEAIIALVARSRKICRHFHIPLQSGDDEILKKMGRIYNRSFFKDLVARIHGMMPDAAVGLDVLVGFPGETNDAFENTFRLVESLPVSYLHVFPFSPRLNTPAYSMPDKVPAPLVKRRAGRMRELGADKKQRFYQKLVGRTMEVLVEGSMDNTGDSYRGRTTNYVPVFLKNYPGEKNDIISVKIDECLNDRGVIGTPISSAADL